MHFTKALILGLVTIATASTIPPQLQAPQLEIDQVSSEAQAADTGDVSLDRRWVRPYKCFNNEGQAGYETVWATPATMTTSIAALCKAMLPSARNFKAGDRLEKFVVHDGKILGGKYTFKRAASVDAAGCRNIMKWLDGECAWTKKLPWVVSPREAPRYQRVYSGYAIYENDDYYARLAAHPRG